MKFRIRKHVEIDICSKKVHARHSSYKIIQMFSMFVQKINAFNFIKRARKYKIISSVIKNYQQQSSSHTLTPVVAIAVAMVPARPVSISGIIQPGIGIRFSFWLGISASFAEIVSVISITMIP